MSVKLSVPILFCVIAVWLWHSPDVYQSGYYEDEFRPVLVAQANTLANEIDMLNSTAVAYRQGTANLKQLRAQLSRTRLTFKRAEGILEYYFPKHIKSYINGPPLNHLDPYPVKEEFNTNHYYGISPAEYSKTLPIDQLNTDHYRGQQRVVAPVGLQVLDEMVFADESDIIAEEVVKLTDNLKETYAVLVKAVEFRNYFYEHEVIEAARLELVRLFTMGITGFDTPGSLNAMEEAAASLAGIQEVLKPLMSRMTATEKQQTETAFKNAVIFLTQTRILTVLTDWFFLPIILTLSIKHYCRCRLGFA